MDTLEYKFYDSGPGSVGSRLDEGLLLLRHFRAQLAETVDKGQALNKQEKLYVLPVTQVLTSRTFQDLYVFTSVHHSAHTWERDGDPKRDL